MNPWAMPCRASQDRLVMVESSDKMWSTGERNGEPLQYSCLENPMNSSVQFSSVIHACLTLCDPMNSSVQFSSVIHACLTLCDPMNCGMPVLPVHHQLPELTQTHVHRVGDAIQPSHPLSSPSPSALNLSQHQGLFKWVSSSHLVAKVLEFRLQHQSFQWIFRTDLL